MNPAPLTDVLARLKGVKQHGSTWEAKCPAHDDRTASLSVSLGKDSRVLLHCHANCSVDSVCGALGIQKKDLFQREQPNGNGVTSAYSLPRPSERPTLVKSYDYTDEHGTLLYQSCRFEPKSFRQRRPDGKGGWLWTLDDVRLVPYRLPEITESIALGHMVWVVEGEKDADALSDCGYSATTNPMGAGKWREEYAKYFRGATVAIVPDNDDPGRAHAEQVAASLTNVGARVKMVSLPGLPPKGDVSDWLGQAEDTDEILTLAEKAPTWAPDPKYKTRWRLDEILENEEIMRPPLALIPRIAWAGRCTLLAAREKIGKSTLVRYAASQVTKAGEFLGGQCAGGTVLYLALEENLGDVGRQFKHFRADPKSVQVINRLSSNGDARLAEIKGHIEAVRPALVVVDTLMAYASGQVSEATSSAQMQPVVDGLTGLAHEYGCAVILIHHGRKDDGSYRDSTAIGAAVDIICEVWQPSEQDDPTLRRVKARGRLPVSDFQFRFDGEAFFLDVGEKPPLDRQIITVVRDRPGCSANDVVDACRPSRRETVLTTIAHLIAGDQLKRTGRGNHGLILSGDLTSNLQLEQ